MDILLGCEVTQAVTIEFRKLGHNAFSCDMLPAGGWHPEWHIQDNLSRVITGNWDLIITFPPCTHLAVSGSRHFARKKLDGRQKKAIDFFLFCTEYSNALENPVGIMSTIYRKPDQIIQPNWFGDPYEKKTCLWLKGLPLLKKTNQVQPKERAVFSSGKSMDRRFSNANPKTRAAVRSATFPGIAQAMAEQWGDLLTGV